MKKLIYLFTLLAFVACQTGTKNSDKNNTNEAVEVVESTISISGMHCDNCVASVTKGIDALEGIENIVVSLNDSNAVVKYDSKLLKLEEIEEAIVKRGYKIKK